MVDRSSTSTLPLRARLQEQEFKLRVYSRRWGHDDIYKLWRADAGWKVQFIQIGGQCDPAGRPYLFENLEHDAIQYPPDLAQRMHRLWREAPMMTTEEIQSRLEMIADHLRAHEQAAGRQAKPGTAAGAGGHKR